MNPKQLILLLIVGIVLGGAGLVVLKHNRGSWKSSGAGSRSKVLADLAVNDVRRIRIRQAGGELNLVRKGDLWRVGERYDYPASFTEISDFLRKLWELKAVQWMRVGPSQYPRLELVTPGDPSSAGMGTLVELRDSGEKTMKSILLGKKHTRQATEDGPFGGGGGYPDGRYLLVLNESKEVALVSELFSNVEIKPDPWLDKAFFKVENPREIIVTQKEPAKSWKLTRDNESAEWKLEGIRAGESLDPSKASNAANALSSPSFNDVVSPQAKPEDTGLNAPTVIAIRTFDGFAYTVKVGKPAADFSYPLQVQRSVDLPKERVPGKDEKPQDKEKLDKEFKAKLQKLEEKAKAEKICGSWTYLVSKSTVDSILKERKDLLMEKKDEQKEKDKKKTVK